VRVIFEKKLANGLNCSIVDHSRPIASDRWYVKVVCDLVMSVRPEAYAGLVTGDTELDRITMERIGDGLEHQFIRERNFVDQAVKDELVTQLTEQLREVVSRFLKDEAMPARLLAAKFREIGNLCALERARATAVREEEDEPADFSHCFR